MDLINIVDNMSEEMYLRLKHAAETGRWPEGNKVDAEQQASAIQLSMAYQSRHLDSDQMLTIGSDGEIVHKTKRALKDEFTQNKNDTQSIARFSKL
ncbi:YeaC family protein [Thalassotalea sp. PLHSN55]|uniref:YeaC family protein n=1 Tax=Thalassotalea sp. PLHSN55 TaxID=3435888 RepID=UPI003F8452C6